VTVADERTLLLPDRRGNNRADSLRNIIRDPRVPLLRSDLWNPAKHCDPSSLPTSGQMLDALSGGACGGEAYDQEWPARARASLW
jgi:hypothetical protein